MTGGSTGVAIDDFNNVLTYVRNSWGNRGEEIPVSKVAEARASLPAPPISLYLPSLGPLEGFRALFFYASMLGAFSFIPPLARTHCEAAAAGDKFETFLIGRTKKHPNLFRYRYF
ncbi:hypothetical protein [Bordetella genomosp. 10]|uniref:hypothetical protein n=1 Tax=Bordetella genomosp. 10 TaxID=1416804 RepID=UPI001177509C|nr:hypothetical protein [Bordetella genomosp. 10]